MYLKKDFTFDAAHRLDHYHGKCEALHGHTYRLQITLKGIPDSEAMVMDFVQLKRLVNEKAVGILDHAFLNDIIPQPTAENIALWIWKQLAEHLEAENRSLYSVQVWETADSSVLLDRQDFDSLRGGEAR